MLAGVGFMAMFAYSKNPIDMYKIRWYNENAHNEQSHHTAIKQQKVKKSNKR